MNFVMLLHCAASSRASPVVILRQLLSPKPSARANVIFLEPHQDGPLPEADAAAVLVAPLALVAAGAELEPPPPLLELLEELEPHAATATTIPRASEAEHQSLCFDLHQRLHPFHSLHLCDPGASCAPGVDSSPDTPGLGALLQPACTVG